VTATVLFKWSCIILILLMPVWNRCSEIRTDWSGAFIFPLLFTRETPCALFLN
jgi:hypothetical protein